MEIINLKNNIDIDFETILKNKSKCDEYISQIEEIMDKIDIKYKTLISNINENVNLEIPIYLGIDSMNFQNKIYIYKFSIIKQLYNKVFNRIYGDYYKMHKLIKKYITTSTRIPAIDVQFIQYKDLDSDKYYSFDEVIKIQNTINQYIHSLYSIITKKNITIQPFLDSDKAGYQVNNYINEENTNITIYTNKCIMFLKYLTTFNKYHNNYILDLILQCRFLITYIKQEINFEIDSELFVIEKFIDPKTDISYNISDIPNVTNKSYSNFLDISYNDSSELDSLSVTSNTSEIECVKEELPIVRIYHDILFENEYTNSIKIVKPDSENIESENRDLENRESENRELENDDYKSEDTENEETDNEDAPNENTKVENTENNSNPPNIENKIKDIVDENIYLNVTDKNVNSCVAF